MDKTLDEIISSRPKNNRRTSNRRGGGAKGQVLGTANAPATRARAAVAINSKAVAGQAQPANKIIVSNLPPDVNEQQVKELFHSTIGPLKEVTLHYDSNGRSKGVAAVHFHHIGDGNKAFQQYNNRLIDGKRPMKIEIVVDPTKRAPPSLVARVSPADAAGSGGAPRSGGRPRRGRGGAGGGGRKREPRPPKTAADLDAEMEDYTANSAPTAATA
ncbi:hypothetical protein QCA50_015504 [Cerrena zonata]|uniref:RRM domain-containing protein n=1 Tax=Cerrena zonata TaxID=2478898 RepID=A0AAW0FMN4_9APHY